MKFTRLKIENFMQIKSAEISLDDRGLVCIQGINEDDTSAKSNGAGKSTLLDAIFWVLYGETARGVGGDHVVSNDAKKDCRVSIGVLDDAGDRWSIVRTRKHSKEGNALMLLSETKPGTGVYDDVSKGTVLETQAAIVRLLGCSADVFKAAVYAGQEQMPDLPGLTDKFLKVLIEEAAGFEELNAAYAASNKRLTAVEKDVVTKQGQIKMVQVSQDAAAAAVQEAEANRDTFETDRASLMANLGDQYAAAQKAADDMGAEILKLNPGNIAAEITALEARIAKSADLVEARAEAANQLGSAQKAHVGKVTIVNTMAVVLKTLMGELAESEKLVGTPCKSCGKDYHECDIGEAKKLLIEKIDAKKRELAAAHASAKQAQTDLSEKEKALTDAEAKLEEVRALRLELTKYNTKSVQVEALRARQNDFLAHRNKIQDSIRSQSAAVNPHLAKLAAALGALAEAADKLAELKDQLTQQVSLAAILEAVSKLYGPSGLRAHMLDTITPFLNEKTERYLSVLSDGNIHAVWTTLVKNGKGELKEKFTIEVTNDKGGKSFAALSGGEKRKVRLACWWALQDLVATRAEKPIDLFLGDEIDYALDDYGLERLMVCLEEKARERGTVLVVSHQSLRDWIDNVIEVRKKDGVSVVEDSYGHV